MRHGLRYAVSALWLLAAVALLSVPVRQFARDPAGGAAPIGSDRPEWRRQWRFLSACGPLVPLGATFTVRAGDGGAEMILYMLALDVLPGRTALPTTYSGRPQPGAGSRADFVLSFGCAPMPGGETRLVARLQDGCVWKRGE